MNFIFWLMSFFTKTVIDSIKIVFSVNATSGKIMQHTCIFIDVLKWEMAHFLHYKSN